MANNPFAAYVEVLRLPGAIAFSAAGFIARLSLGIVGIGTLLYISNTTNSYAYAGLLQALFATTSAVAALFTSRLADKFGQRAVLIPLPCIFAFSLVSFVFAVQVDTARWMQMALIIVAGASFPSFGSFVRARWVYATLKDTDSLRSAFALESIFDELVFAIGPLLAAFLAFNVGLPSPVLVAGGLALIGGFALASLTRSIPPVHEVHPEQSYSKNPLRHQGLTLLVTASLGIGILFGSFDVAIVAFTKNAGQPELAGVTLALWAVGSMFGGIIYGSRHLRMPLPRQVQFTSLAMVIITIPMPLIANVNWLMLGAFLSGFAIAPTLISTFSLAERLVPPSLLTQGLTWVNSGLALGFAAGASLGGILADRFGTPEAFGLGVAGACLTLSVSVFAQGRWKAGSRNRPLPQPGLALNSDLIPGPAPSGFVDDPT